MTKDFFVFLLKCGFRGGLIDYESRKRRHDFFFELRQIFLSKITKRPGLSQQVMFDVVVKTLRIVSEHLLLLYSCFRIFQKLALFHRSNR